MPQSSLFRVLAVTALGAAVIGVVVLGGESRTDLDAAAGFAFDDVAARVGVEFRHFAPTLDPRLDNVAPHVAAIGASVAVADVNRDGWNDLFLTSSRFGTECGLFVNAGDGTFANVTSDAGLEGINREGEGVAMGAVWGDYDNDGYEDLFLYKWGYQQLFRNVDGQRFEDVTATAGLRQWMNANGAIWFDYDRDGLLDLYVAGYFRDEVDFWNVTTTKIMHNSFEFATNGGKNHLFRNLGNGRFTDVTDDLGVGSTRWTLALASADFNQDGWPDLYLANDYGPEELFLNEEGKRFTLENAGLLDDSKSGMSVSLGDVYNRGRLDVFVTNISERGYLFQGNNLRINFLSELGRFENVAEDVVADAGWAWGAQFGDLNNDGWLELFVANGFISAHPERDYWYGMSKVAGGQGLIFEDAANWPPIGDASLSGFQRSRLLTDPGTGTWTDIAPAVGIDDHWDGRAVAFADLWNRGMLDVLVANQHGPAVIYRNESGSGNWLQLDLVGRRSNRAAIGAEVVIEFAGKQQRRVVDGGMGFASQNQRRLHFGLGDAGVVERVVIHWPSGSQQVIERPAINTRHVIEEPLEP